MIIKCIKCTKECVVHGFGMCSKCYRRDYYLKNKEHTTKINKEYVQANKDARKLYTKKWQAENKDRINRKARELRLKNLDKYLFKEAVKRNKRKSKARLKEKEYRKKYPDKLKAKNAKRRADKLNATPKWANLEMIKEIYKNCPQGYHVDHIIPLKGRDVCGFHVEYNLQYLTPNENLTKGNKV